MTKKINYDTVFNWTYFPLLILNILEKLVNVPNTGLISQTYTITMVGMLFLFLLKVIIDKMTVENIFAIFIVSIILLLKLLIGSNYTHTYMLVPFLLGSQLLSNRNSSFLKYSFWVKVTFFLVVFSLGKVSVLPSIQVIKSNGTTALSMGFVHTNSMGIYGFSILIDYILLNCRKNITYVNLILISLFVLIIYQLSLSRNFLLLSIGLLIGLISTKYFNKIYLKKSTLQITTILIFMFGTFLWMAYNPNNLIWQRLNTILSNRPMLSKYYLNFYEIQWLPQNFERLFFDRFWDKLEYYLDNSFLQILLSQGLIISILLFCFVIFAQQRKRFDFITSMLLIFVYVCLIIEAIPFNIFLLTPLFYQYFDMKE